jgi:hypothetical protein
MRSSMLTAAFVLPIFAAALAPSAASADSPPAGTVRSLAFELVESGSDGAVVTRVQPRIALREGARAQIESSGNDPHSFSIDLTVGPASAGKAPVEVNLTYGPATRFRAILRTDSELSLGKPTELGQIALAGGNRLRFVATLR